MTAPQTGTKTYFHGSGGINVDSQQDGFGAIRVDSEKTVTVELKKPLNSSDASGKDVSWAVGTEHNFIVMWDSSETGGTANHKVSTRYFQTLLIDPDTIPELPSLAFFFLLVLGALAALFARRFRHSSPWVR